MTSSTSTTASQPCPLPPTSFVALEFAFLVLRGGDFDFGTFISGFDFGDNNFILAGGGVFDLGGFECGGGDLNFVEMGSGD